MSTQTLHSSGEKHCFSDKNPNVRFSPSEDCTTDFQGMMAEGIESQRRGISHSPTPNSTKRKRVPDLTNPGTEVISSHFPAHFGIENIKWGTMTELEAVLAESTKVIKPSDDGLKTIGMSSSNDNGLKELATCVPNSEAGPSNPTPRRVVVEIPTGVDLLSNFSEAAKLFGSLLGLEEKANLEERELEKSFSQLITSILQSHQFAIAYRGKVSSQMDKHMDHSSEVEHLKSEASLLQAEINELRSRNAGLQDENEILQVARNILSQRLQEVRREHGRHGVELSILTKSNKELQEKVAQLEADLALVRDKDEKERARLEAKVKALRMRRNNDKHSVELYKNWMVLKTRVDTLHEIQNNNLDLPLAIAEAEAAAKSAKGFVEQVLSGKGEDGSESDDENKDAPPLS